MHFFHPRRLFLSAACGLCSAAFLTACSSPHFRELDSDLHGQVEAYRTEAPKLRKRIEEDDAALDRAAAARTLPTEDRKTLNAFIADRRDVLRRFESSVDEWAVIDKELHAVINGARDEAKEKALQDRLEKFHDKTRALNTDFDSIQQRETEIRNRLMAIPKN